MTLGTNFDCTSYGMYLADSCLCACMSRHGDPMYATNVLQLPLTTRHTNRNHWHHLLYTHVVHATRQPSSQDEGNMAYGRHWPALPANCYLISTLCATYCLYEYQLVMVESYMTSNSIIMYVASLRINNNNRKKNVLLTCMHESVCTCAQSCVKFASFVKVEPPFPNGCLLENHKN